MSVPKSEPLYTVEEYLALERQSEERHEYLDGRIFLMAGETPQHGTICMNLSRVVSTQLLGTPCQAFSKDTKLRSGPDPKLSRSLKALYPFPDLMVVCGEMLFHDQHRDVVLNPAVIVEVLSPTTEAFDRGGKFLRYQAWNPSLTDYILVSQFEPIVEHFVRQPDGSWTLHIYQGLDKSFVIESINCKLLLSDIYDRITFAAEPLVETE